jgi:hypothetical protein
MTMPASPAVPPAPPLDLEVIARRFAAMERDAAEIMIDAQVATAIREWRISDATFWQRIRFRSRMIRTATAHRQGPSAPSPATKA